MTKLKSDKNLNLFPYRSLTPLDKTRLEHSLPMQFPIDPNDDAKLRSLDDFEAAYWENKNQLLSPQSAENPAGYQPGVRSWLFWRCQHRMGPPKEPVIALNRLHLLTRSEKAELPEWVKRHPHLYTDREKKLIATWQPTGQPAPILKFDDET